MRIDTLSLMLSSKKEKSPILSCCKLTTRGCHTYLHYRGSNELRWGQDPPVLGTELMHGATKLSLLPPQRWRKTPRAIKEASGRARPSEASTGCPPARRAALLVRPRELVWSASRGEGERRAGGRFPKLHPCPREDRLLQLRPPLSSLLSLLAAPKEPQRLGTLWQ